MIQANTNFVVERKFFGGVIPSIDAGCIRGLFHSLRKRISDAYNVTVTEDDMTIAKSLSNIETEVN